ncbi:MAG: right-handed parallel beta-helix repeat-containing protein [Paludibacteraceae bacterium]|nr:right-handed parallel beta-helix repeat-containing protein [Paludibacteraceae bacterium]
MKRTLILFGLLLGFALHSYPANYYVKMDGEGDGSSWENAMGNERFAETLKSAPDGSTFHIAKGTYYPTYDTTFIHSREVHPVKVYPIRSQVSIIGGYPEDAGDGAVSEPDKYVTCFSADFGGDDEFTLSASTFGNGMDSMVVSNYEENSPIIFDVYNVKGSLSFRGVEMTGASLANVYVDERTSKVNLTMSRSKIYNSAGGCIFAPNMSCLIDSCLFENNGISAPYDIGTALYFYGATGCKITNSYFERNGFLNVALNSSGAEFYSGEVSKCTFYKNCSGVGSVLEVVDSLRISNCNFVENYSRAMPCINSFLQLDCCNSIFINNKSYHDEPIFESPIVVTAWEDQSYKIYGNIIIGSKYGVLYSSSYAEHLVNMHCGNNLVFTLPTNGENTSFPNEDDWYYSDEDIATVLDGSYNKATGVFTPKLTADENSFVPYIKLVSDRLPDSTQIRFPLSRSIVSEDQCGQKRYEMTCAGSYEFPLCPTDTTFATDTLIAGEPFIDGVVYTVGRHDSIFETITLPNGCDSVVMHSLIVKPDPTKLNYYVKTERWGAGDGSSWENAMDSIDFATYLPLAPDGATFYVAEGVYRPVYDAGLFVPKNSSSKCYAINSNVTIRGGYPADATGTDVPSEPKKYQTIFDGDASNELFFAKNNAKNLVFSGVQIINCRGTGILRIVNNADSLVVMNSVFSNCEEFALRDLYNSKSLHVRNTMFLNNNNSIHIPSVISTKIEKCSFIENSGYLILNESLESESKLLIDSVSFIDNEGSLIVRGSVSTDIVNSIFNRSSGHYFNSSSLISIRKCKISSSEDLWLSTSISDIIKVDSCVFIDNEALLISGPSELLIFNSLVENNISLPIIQETDNCVVEKSSFYNNGHQYVDHTPMVSAGNIRVENSVCANNRTGYGIFHVKDALIANNNTILGVLKNVVHGSSKIAMNGNIILYNDSLDDGLGNLHPNSCYDDFEYFLSFKNNVIFGDRDDFWDKEIESNSFVSGGEINSLLEGYYVDGLYLFTPVLAYNGGFTPTVALKSDRLPDGTSIRFPLSETTVTTDQRGVERLEQTCMGAYELVCSPAVVELADTIVAGDDYSFNNVDLSSAISKVGVHKFSDTLRCVSGCDSIIQLSLTVRPQKREGGYYVKKKGTGDGSDWENAMSPEDFSNHLPLAYDGDTFHIAEGVYKSSFVDSTMGRVYRVNSSVSLIGGYPDTVSSISTPPTPELFVTKLSADVKNNDYTYYYPQSLDYTPYSNFEENDSLLLYVTGEKKLTLFGLTLSGVKSCDRGVIDLSDGASLEMNQTVVQGNAASAIRGENVDVIVNNSLFTHNYSKRGTVFRLKGSKLNVYSSSAYENMALVNDCDAQYAVGGIFYLENSEVLVENSTLASNSADMGGVFGFKSSKLNLINNTVVGNQLLPTSSHQGSVLASLDAQDETELSSVVLFGNLIAGNQHPEIGGYANFESGDYNIFSFNAASISQGEHDMFMTDPKEIQQLLDGEMLYNSESVFIPVIQYNGGYTPTIAVIQSLFNGGDILSIPRAERKVDYDQRGFVRKDTSCVGAFEFPTFMGYYVKKNSQGDGSGRNWENCMGDTTFARYFPIVPTNASFYIAEGTYSPMFDSYGKLTKSKSRSYSSARLLNLYGGYPADAQDGSVANPAKYKTTLSVDYNGDDIYTLSQEGYSSITSLNTSDNGYYIVSIYSKTPGYAEIKGIEFRGQRCVPKASSSALNLHAYNTTGLNFRLEQCSFIGNYTGVSSSCDSMIVTECFFDTISAYAFSHSSFQSEKSSFLLVDKSTFANSLYSLYTYSAHGLMRVQNSTFANSVYNILPPGDFSVSADNTKLEIYNNSFFSNSKENVGLFIYDFIPVELKGNIFSFSNIMVQSDPNYRNESLPIVSDFNVYTAKSDAISLGVHDTIVSPLSIAEIVKGEVKDDRFEVELTQQESYVMTPTLVNVNFAEGGGIKRMPENATPVTEDQRGVERPTVDYCVGAIEADCDFSGSVMKLNAEKTEVCRGDSVELKLSGLTLLEENTFKFRWSSNDAKALFSDSAVHDTKLYLKGQEELVEAKLTITNVCGQDTVLTVAMKVNGIGEVPFTGIDEQGTVCLNVAEPIELSSEVEGAMFRGECIVNGHFFDPTLAETDSTIVRCYIESEDTGCEIYTEQVVYVQRRDESAKPTIQLLKSADQTCGITPNGMLQFVISDIPENLTFRVEGPAYPECVKETIEHTGKREISVTIDSILAGDYQISVTDGCYDYGSVTATIEDLYSLQITREPQITDVHCYGEKNGAALFKVKRNTDDFNMILENKDEVEETPLLEFNESVLQISGLAGGEYRLILQSTSEFCMDETAIQFSVSAPTKPFEISQLNVTGEGCEATIEPIVIAGGTEGIEYKWTNFVSSQEVLTETPEPTLFNSGAGKYMCVAYSKECNLIDTAYVEVPSSSVVVENLIITPNAIDEACMGMNNGRIKCTIDSVNKKRVEVTIVTENLSNGVKTLSTYNRADNIIRVNDLAPGDYRITAYQGSPECVDAPSDFDTVLTIRPMLNSLQFISLDEIADAHCLSNKDAYAKLTAIGVAANQTMEILSDNVVVNSYKYFDRVADTAYYNAKNLVSGDFVARIINSCSDTALYNFSIGGTQPFELSIDSAISIFTYDCPTDDGPKGTVKAVCEGGADSMRISLFKYDRKNPTIAKEIATDKINQGMMPYSATYQDLLSGKYVVRLESLIPNCSDHTEVEFEIVGNDIIHLDSLIVEGRGCDAIIIPYASGDETGYTFHWNNAISHLEKSSSDTLFHAGAGTFSCVALSNHCKAYSDTLFVNVPSGSTPINVNITLTHRDESCFEANNGYIRCAVDSVNGERVPVTIVTEKLGEDKFIQVTYDDPHYKDNVIRVWDVEPGEYRVTAYQGSLECVEAPSDFDTIITIKPMLNQLQFHSLDSIKEAVCLAERDAHAYLTAIGVAPGQHIEVLHADTLYAEFSYKWRKEDTAHYDISNLIFGDFTARIINSCKDTVLYDFMVGGTKPYIVSVDSSKSELKVKCPSDTTGIISALFSGGADSCFCYLQRLNSDGRYKIIQSGVVFSHEAVQEVKYTGLGKGNYMLVMTSTIPGCNDIGIFNIEITGPADVVGRHQILDISCNAFTDGSVTFKPHRRGTSSPVNYVIHRDSALIEEHYDAYMLYKKEETKVPDRWGDMVDGYSFTPVMYENDKQIAVKINKVFDSNEFYYRDGNSLKKIESMETLEKFAPGLYQNDFVSSSFKWYQKSEDNWLELTNIVLPDSSDFDEAWYFSGKDTIKTPVWGCSHLDQFWEEEFGAYLESDAITLANLAPAWYKVIFEDTLGCPFVDSFEVKRPVRPLKFDSVSFDAELAECDPAHRYITAYVDGGWGGYNYSFAPENVGDKQGGAYDGYLGGNYVQYDSKKLKGSCRSEFLLPGNYLVMVVDEKGCFEKFNAGTRIAVKSKFSATVDTVNVLCPEEDDAPVVLNLKDDEYNGLYDIYEYASDCLNNTCDTCNRDTFSLVRLDAKKDTVQMQFGNGTHGLFIYRTSNDKCGTYVPAVVTDTIPAMRLQMEAMRNVSCAEAPIDKTRDGMIKLSILGGVEPYTLYRDKSLFSDEHISSYSEFKDSSIYKNDQLIKTIKTITLNDLAVGRYYFTVVDQNNCIRHMGADKSVNDTVIVLDSPKPISSLVTASSICPKEGLADGIVFADQYSSGGVFTKYVDGGVAPYSYRVEGFSEDLSDPYIPVTGDETSQFHYVITDNNGCLYDTTVMFGNDEIKVERIDFLVSKYNKNGDVIALVDMCGPEAYFDSVSYEISGEHAEKFEILDRRMLIYDIEGGSDKAKKILYSQPDTKSIPDGFFAENFQLIDKFSSINKHINFIKLNETASSAGSEEIWRECHLKMYAYFNGCRYTVEKNGIVESDIFISQDDFNMYEGGVQNNNDILDISLSPNPYSLSGMGELKINITFGAEVDYNIYIYSMDGNISTEIVGKASDLKASSVAGEFVVEKRVNAADIINVQSQVFVVLVRTRNDADAKLLLIEN